MTELIVFAAVVGAVAVVGLGLGLVLARRISRWDERRAPVDDRAAADEGSEDDSDRA